MAVEEGASGSAPSSGFDVARRMGLLDPARAAATVAALGRWGPTLATAYRAAALRHPNRPAVIDDSGELTYARLDRRSTALARGLRTLGLDPGTQLGILCRNHRRFVEATVGAAKASLVPVYLNTGFGASQLADVLAREGVDALIADECFAEVVADSGFEGTVITGAGQGDLAMRDVRRMRSVRSAFLVPHATAPVLLTSGTTGTPKGARRSTRVDPRTATAVISRIPYRSDDVFVIPTPLFHAWGLAQLSIAAGLGATVVTFDFDAEAVIARIAEHRATVLAAVPVMLQRMLAHPALDGADLHSLRIVATSGSALAASVATEWLDRVGHNLYNLYGSTEVGQATLATPDDLRAAPGTAGRVLPGSVVHLLDEHGSPVPAGEPGRIFVGNGAQFSGYTGGGGKEVIGGLMSSGDVGVFDEDGRLFVTGRADDMIVSGGENVFPGEVEELLLELPGVADAAVVGVPDDEFGQRLVAYVVRENKRVTAPKLRAEIATRLARHKVPRSIEFVDELPRTPTGKVLRRRLPPPGTP